MKTVTFVSFLAMGALFTGCGSNNGSNDGSTPQPDLSGSAQDLTSSPQPDLTASPKVDMAYTPSTDGGAFMCGGAGNCAAQGKTCCVNQSGASCQTSCGDAGFPVQCSGPEFCGGDPCCATVTGTTIQSVACTTSPSACVPMFSAQSSMTRVCHADIDCTAGGITTNYKTCCTISGTPERICASAIIAAASGGQLTCP